MTEQRAAPPGAEAARAHRMYPRFAIRLERIETWSAKAERWESERGIPDWAKGDDNNADIALAPHSDSKLSVAVQLLVRDTHPRAVQVEIVAFYELAMMPAGSPPPRKGNITDTKAFVDSLAKHSVRRIINQALRDIMPYMREAVHSLSVRVFPQHPIVLSGGLPELPSDLRFYSADRGSDTDKPN